MRKEHALMEIWTNLTNHSIGRTRIYKLSNAYIMFVIIHQRFLFVSRMKTKIKGLWLN